MTFDQSNVQQLLSYALQERHTESVIHLLSFTTDVPTVLPFIQAELDIWMTNEPDAVYFFVRTVLATAFDVCWLPLLNTSARASLEIVIEHGDSESVMEWLRLIAREPATYQLNDIMREGIRSAQLRAHDDGVLGGRLLLFTLKRASDLVGVMMNDHEFISALATPIGVALQTFEHTVIKESIEVARDLGLVIFAQAIQLAPSLISAANVFNPDTIHYLWSLYTENDSFGYLIDDLKPAYLISQLVDASTTWLSDDAVQSLLTHAHINGDDTVFANLSHLLAMQDRGEYLARLNNLYIEMGQPPEAILPSLTHLQESDIITPLEVASLAYQIGTASDWRSAKGKAYVEYLGRLFQQNANLQLPLDALRKLHKLAGELRLEMIQKTFLKRIHSHLDAQIEDAPPLDIIIELQDAISWSNMLQTHFLSWWRGYALHQPLTRLQFIEKSFEGKRPLEPLRAVVQTTIAIRKFLGKRSLDEVATSLNSAFSLLQLLSDSFDPMNNKPIHFDQMTFQMEMSQRAEELTARERSVFAKNLRELANLITQMADYRSKSTLIRREDDIERQLVSGEQDPQSAIDAMRWLSGLLGRLQ